MKNVLFLIFIIYPFKLFAGELNIVTTIKPIYSIINGIIGKYNSNYLLIKKNQSIHNYNIKPSDLHKINNADIIFLIDFNLEFYIEKMKSKINDKAYIIQLSSIPNLKLLPFRENTVFSNNNEHDHSHGAYDYHIWLDVDNVKIIVSYILEIISEKDPGNKVYYQQNANLILDRLNDIDKKLRYDLANYSDIPYLVSHDAYQYFEKKYNLNPLGAISINPEGNISLKKIAELQELIQKNNVKCIFTEPNYPQSVISKLAKSTGTNLETLDPEWGSDKNDIEGYIELLESISNSVRSCLGSSK